MSGLEDQFRFELAACALNEKKRTDPMFVHTQDVDGPCLAVDATNDVACWLPEGHSGKHTWQTPRDPSDCPRCGKDSCCGDC